MKKNNNNISKFLSGIQWIGGPGNSLCRKEFFLREPVKKAIIRIVADPHSYVREYWQPAQPEGKDSDDNWLLGGSFLKYRIFVNGELIGAGPARPVNDGIPPVHCFELDLRQGINVIGIFSRGEQKGFALQLETILADGRKFRLHSDETWKTLNMDRCYSPVCWYKQNINQFFKGCAGPGEWYEHIDGTEYPFGWNETGFDDRNWDNAKSYGPTVEQLDTREIMNYGISRISPVNICKIDDQHWLIDFGQEYIGGIELTGPAGGGCVELRLGEELMANGRVRYQMRTENCYQEIWRFPDGGRTLSHFGLRSFRYLGLLGYDGELTNGMVSIVSVTTPFKQNESSFSCAENKLEQVWQLCKNTIAFTTMDVYNDCFSRERTAYEADSYINMLSHFAVESNTLTAKRTIEYLMTHPTYPCEWRQLMIPLFYEYTLQTGDLDFVEQYYQKLRDECSFMNFINKGLINKFPQEIIIDWPPSCQDNYEIGNFCGVPNAFLYWDLELLSQMAAFLEKTVDCAELSMLAELVKTAFNAELFNPETGLYIDSENSKHSSFHVNMFALRFGLVPEECVEKCLDFIIGKGMVCSVYGAQFYLEALFMRGRAAEAVALMTADNDTSWLGMLRRGTTITTESWNPAQKANMSWAHPWGSAPANVIVRHLFGLRPTAPGWHKYEFKPQPGGIFSAKIKFPLPFGIVHAGFSHDNSGRIIKEIEFDSKSSAKTFTFTAKSTEKKKRKVETIVSE